MFRRFLRHIKDGFIGVKRHFGMAFSSAIAVTITLLLIGVFAVLTLNLNALTKEIEGNISLSVLLDYDFDGKDQRTEISNEIKSINGVASVEYRSKDEEFEYYVSQYSDEEVIGFYELYKEDNPFHDIFLVGVNDTTKLDYIKNEVTKINGVYSVYDGGSNTYLLVDVLAKVRMFGGGLVLALCFLAVYLIYNTIKITIASRDTEIEIMRFVGAKNSYIRAPFLVEGIIIGVIGSIIPIAAIIVGYYYLYKITGGVLLGVLTLLPLSPYMYYVGAGMLIIAVVVGYIGSFISVCKCLRKHR